MPELDLIKLSALTNSIDAADSAKDSALAAATEALSASDIDPNYISYTVGTKPSPVPANGIIGAYYTSAGTLQKLKSNGTAWEDVGEVISTKSGTQRLSGQIANLAENTIWEPDAEPAASTYIDWPSADANEFITNLWEPLRASDTDYITRSVLGQDESGTYDIYKYVFEPPSYEKTIVVTCSVHGLEVMGQIAVYRFLHNVVNKWKASSSLSFARWKIRWVVIPMVNPWGVSQSPRTRGNSNVVDINRNYDYRWAEFTPSGTAYAKGVSAFSEAETQIVRDLVEVSYPKAHAVIDCHDFGQNNPSSGFYPLFVPDQSLPGPKKEIATLMNDLVQNAYETVDFRTFTNYPTTHNYFASQGYQTCNPEWNFAIPDSTRFNAEDMTAAVRWYGNVLLRCCFLGTAEKYRISSPTVKSFSFFNASGLIPTTKAEILPDYTFNAPTAGLLMVYYQFVLSANAATQVVFYPVIDQNSSLYDTNLEIIAPLFVQNIREVGERDIVNSMVPMHVNAGEVRINLEAVKTVGTIEFIRGNIRLVFFPADGELYEGLSLVGGEWVAI